MDQWLASWTQDRELRVRALNSGHYIVFLGKKTLYSQHATNLMLGGSPTMN